MILVSCSPAFSLDFSEFSKSDESSWVALEKARLNYQNKDFGEALDGVLKAKDLKREEIQGALDILNEALSYEAVRRIGDDIVRIREKLEERKSYKALMVLDEVFVSKNPGDFGNSMKNLLTWLQGLVSFPEALFLEGNIYSAEGEFKLAQEYYSQAWENNIYFDIPDEKYSLLYKIADLADFTGDTEKKEQALLLVVSGDPVFALPGNETGILLSMKKNLSQKENLESFFLLYRHDKWFALKAYHDLAEYYYGVEGGTMERAFTCSMLASSIIVTKLSYALSDREVDWHYKDLKNLLKTISRHPEILVWMDENKCWETLLLFGDNRKRRALGHTHLSEVDLFPQIDVALDELGERNERIALLLQTIDNLRKRLERLLAGCIAVGQKDDAARPNGAHHRVCDLVGARDKPIARVDVPRDHGAHQIHRLRPVLEAEGGVRRAQNRRAHAGGGLDRIGNRRNFVTEERQTAQHHLQTVVFRRIVRTGNRNARTATEVMGSEIKHRCRLHADVLNVDTCRHDTLHESR